MQDIGFDHINPSIFIGEIFLDDTGKFTVCNGCGVLPVMTGQHFILKAIFIPFNLADDGGIQDPMFRNAFYQIIEPVALIQPERMASESTNGLRGKGDDGVLGRQGYGRGRFNRAFFCGIQAQKIVNGLDARIDFRHLPAPPLQVPDRQERRGLPAPVP